MNNKCQNKVCPPEKICNPSSSICVLKNGKIGKEIIKAQAAVVAVAAQKDDDKDDEEEIDFQKCKNKTCPQEKICNHDTSICVLRSGSIGKKIVPKEKEQREKREEKRKRREEEKKQKEQKEEKEEKEEKVPPKPWVDPCSDIYCNISKICDPTTIKCTGRTTKKGKKLVEEEKKRGIEKCENVECKENEICNPSDGNCSKFYSNVGKTIKDRVLVSIVDGDLETFKKYIKLNTKELLNKVHDDLMLYGKPEYFKYLFDTVPGFADSIHLEVIKKYELIPLIIEAKGGDKKYPNVFSNFPCSLFEDKYLDAVRSLVEHGANVNIPTMYGEIPIECAVKNNAIEVVKYLANHGANLNALDNKGIPLLVREMTAGADHHEMVKILIEYGADVNQRYSNDTPLIIAAYNNSVYVKILLDHGAIVDTKGLETGYTPLMYAIIRNRGKLDTIKLLVDAGADINAVGNNGKTPLILARESRFPNIYDFLVTGKIINIHPRIGVDTDYGNGDGIGDPAAKYQIPLSKKFVQLTQFRPLPLDNEELKIILQQEPKPHVVYACPVGHLHSADNCGIPMVLTVCSNECPFLTGGVQHFLAPGNYIVYHDDYAAANVWHGKFPVYDYPSYELLVEQYNMAAEKNEIQTMDAEPEKAFTNIARLVDNVPINDDTLCSICEMPVEEGKTYAFPECGHLICEECLTSARGGNLANINVGDAENMQRRRCGICGTRFRFGKVVKYKAYKSAGCTIL